MVSKSKQSGNWLTIYVQQNEVHAILCIKRKTNSNCLAFHDVPALIPEKKEDWVRAYVSGTPDN